MIKHIAFLLISILPAQAGTIPLKKGDSVSEILYHEYSIGTPGHPQRLYGEKGMVKKVFELNHLPIEKANKMKSGFLLKLPDEIMNPRSEIPVSLPSATMEEAPEVKTLPMQVAVNEPPAVIQEASAVEPTTPEPDNAGVDVIEAGMKWKWRKPNFVLLGGTYLSNKANASHKTSGATNALSRNIEPMVGGEITLRWGQEGYSFEAISRAMFNKTKMTLQVYPWNLFGKND